MNHAPASAPQDSATVHQSARDQGRRWTGGVIPRKIRVILVIALLSIMAALQLTSIREEVQTIDEGVHLTSGISYWLTGDYRLNEEHPPLVKLLAALPVVLSRPNIDWSLPSWQEGNQWAFARDILYYQGNNADTLLFLGRLPMIGLCLLLGYTLYLWGRRLGGDLAGLLALVWFVFDPNFLAHGRYITTDVPLTLGYSATLYVLAKLLNHWTWKRMLAFSAVFGLTQVTKFSALFLYGIILVAPALWLYAKTSTKILLKRTAVILALGLAGTAVMVTIVYGGQFKRGGQDPWIQSLYRERQTVVAEQRVASQPKLIQRIITFSDPATRTGAFIERIVVHTPIPSWSYFKGIVLVLNHDFWGHIAYLNGHHSNFGWWWYFPFAILVKTPFATLLMLVLVITSVIRSKKFRKGFLQPHAYLLAGTGLTYVLWSMTSNLNLGLRHVFPFYPIVFVSIGVFLTSAVLSWQRLLRFSIIGISALYILSSALAYPAYTAYFSELVGGAANGPKYLVDSNIDWGQDVKRLIRFTKEHKIPFVCMSYFGQASLSYYGLDNRYLPSEADPHAPENIQCVVAISVTSLLSQDNAYAWLREYVPDKKIGGSIYVYDFRDGRSPQKVQKR